MISIIFSQTADLRLFLHLSLLFAQIFFFHFIKTKSHNVYNGAAKTIKQEKMLEKLLNHKKKHENVISISSSFTLDFTAALFNFQRSSSIE